MVGHVITNAIPKANASARNSAVRYQGRIAMTIGERLFIIRFVITPVGLLKQKLIIGERGMNPEEIANARWSYIKGLLELHGEDPEVIEKCREHYRSGFIHGTSYGVEHSAELKPRRSRKSKAETPK